MTDISYLNRQIIMGEDQPGGVLKLRAEQPQFDRAIGRLTTWGMEPESGKESYQMKVTLYCNAKENEIIATYWRLTPDGEKHFYTIGAIFRDGEVSFHS